MDAGESSSHALELVAVGAVPPVLLREAAKNLEPRVGRAVAVAERGVDGAAALDLVRRQYLATGILDALSRQPVPAGSKRIGVTPFDLFLPVFTHLFGYAQLGGTLGVVSTFRIQPEEGSAPDLLLRRLTKEILHEFGHTLGLVHCPAQWCVMHPSRWPEELDLKDMTYCAPCAATAGVPR